MNINIDSKYGFEIKPNFTIQAYRYAESIDVCNFGLSAAHKICELMNENAKLRKALNDIKRYQEIVSDDARELNTTLTIVNKAINILAEE